MPLARNHHGVKRLGYLLFLLSASAVLLELTLQVGSLIVYSTHARANPTGEVLGGILCVGDSFTFGSGASHPRHSYPMVLERLLREKHGLDVEVTNLGWPGRNSRELLQYLGEQLERTRPAVLSVLIGGNDRWSGPALLTPEEIRVATASDRFALRWRTRRLFALALRERSDWVVPFEDAETLSKENSPIASSKPTEAMRMAADKLLREAGIEPGSKTPHPEVPRAPELTLLLAETGALTTGRDYLGARNKLIDVTDEIAGHPAVRRQRVEVFMRLGERERALAEIELLRSTHRRHATGETASALLAALHTAGLWDEAFATSRKTVVTFPDLPMAWQILGHVSLPRDPGAAAIAYERFIELSDLGHPRVLVRVGKYVGRSDPERALRILSAAALLKGSNSKALRSSLRAVVQRLSRESLQALLERDDLDDAGRHLLAKNFVELTQPETDDYLQVLREHLVMIRRLASQYGAVTLFLSYPRSHAQIHEVHSSRPKEEYVQVRERFQKELETRSRKELFVADGHCNDAGYGILADTVADAVVKRFHGRTAALEHSRESPD